FDESVPVPTMVGGRTGSPWRSPPADEPHRDALSVDAHRRPGRDQRSRDRRDRAVVTPFRKLEGVSVATCRESTGIVVNSRALLDHTSRRQVGLKSPDSSPGPGVDAVSRALSLAMS